MVAQGAVSAEAEGHARQVVLWAILHTADLSNPARPLPLGAEWGHLVAREFLAQVAAAPLLSPYSFTAPSRAGLAVLRRPSPSSKVCYESNASYRSLFLSGWGC